MNISIYHEKQVTLARSALRERENETLIQILCNQFSGERAMRSSRAKQPVPKRGRFSEKRTGRGMLLVSAESMA